MVNFRKKIDMYNETGLVFFLSKGNNYIIKEQSITLLIFSLDNCVVKSKKHGKTNVVFHSVWYNINVCTVKCIYWGVIGYKFPNSSHRKSLRFWHLPRVAESGFIILNVLLHTHLCKQDTQQIRFDSVQKIKRRYCSITDRWTHTTLLNKTKVCSGPALGVHIFNVWTVDMQSSNIQEWNQITPKLHNVIFSRWHNTF